MIARPTNEYLEFVEDVSSSGKTARVSVHSVRSGQLLATIAWYGPWRQYTFQPVDGTVWNNGCLATITRYVEALMADRRTVASQVEEL